MDSKEKARIKEVERYLGLKISKENELQKIVNLAAEICETSMAVINLIDADTQHSLFATGLGVGAIDRKWSFCNETIEQDDIMIVRDSLNDKRFIDNPSVTGEPNVRFYAGAQLRTHDGFTLGTLCVVGTEPKELTTIQQQLLKILSANIIHILEFESGLDVLKRQYEEAKSAEVKVRSFFESSLSCYLLIDTDYNVVYFNQLLAAFVKRLYKTEIAIGMKVTDFIPTPYMADFLSNFDKALQGIPIQVERQIDFEDETVWFYLAYESARDSDGRIVGVSFNSIDITNKIEQQRTIFNQNESLRAIAQIQSHELRRPVASILGLMDFLKSQNYKFTEETIEMMETAVSELDDRIHEIVAQTAVK